MRVKTSRMSSVDRRAAIIRAARDVFVEKGFDRTTTRQLADAAGVSEALLFKHFPTKEALYEAIQTSCFKEEGLKFAQRLEALVPCTATLAFLIEDLVSRILSGPPDDEGHVFFRLVLRSLMEKGEFTRLALQGGPSRWVKKIEQCLKASAPRRRPDRAARSGGPGRLDGPSTGHRLPAAAVLPGEPLIDYRASHEELVKQTVLFSLRGMGLNEDALRRYGPGKARRQPLRKPGFFVPPR